MPRILCVHPEARELETWRRALLDPRRGWEVEVFTAVGAAWERLHAAPPDLVMAPLTLALDGRVLLQQVREAHPGVARVLVGAGVLDERASEGQRVAQRVLPDDLPAGEMVESLSHLLKLRELVERPELRRVLGRVGQLPAAPSVHARLVRRLRDPNATLSEFADIVGEDPALSAQVLRLANGAYFGRGQSVTGLEAAAARLGTRLLTSIVLAAEAFGGLGPVPASFSIEAFQQHSTLVARIATGLEPRAPWNDDAFTSGLLHDVGKLLIATQLPAEHEQIRRQHERSGEALWQIERRVLGTDHGELGASLLGQWGLPTAVLEAVHHHHGLALEGEIVLDPVMAVTIADRLAHEVERFAPGTTAANPGAISFGDPRWPWWRELAEQLANDALAV